MKTFIQSFLIILGTMLLLVSCASNKQDAQIVPAATNHSGYAAATNSMTSEATGIFMHLGGAYYSGSTPATSAEPPPSFPDPQQTSSESLTNHYR